MRIKDRLFKSIVLFLLTSLILSFFTNSKVISVQAIDVKTQDVQPATVEVKFYRTINSSSLYLPSLAAAIPRINANIAHNNNFRGQGTFIVILDTGIESVHSFFGNRVALEACFAPVCPNKQDNMIGAGAAVPVHWHGTHVAGIAAGSNSSFNGIAPSAGIIAVNVFGPDGSSSDSNIIRALKWVDSISGQYNIAAVNMSLGTMGVFKSSCNSYLPDLTAIIATLKSKNIATVVSAGNEGQRGMSSPACITDTVSVAATYFSSGAGVDKVTDFSNVSDLTDLSAPGYQITSSKLLGSYGASSGTSMSAPMVTGAFAVYRSKYGVQAVDKVVLDFQSTGVDAKDDYTSIITKRIDFKVMFSSGGSIPPPTTTIPSPTTTVPSPTTTVPSPGTITPSPTTTIPSIDDDDDAPENFLNIPYIAELKKYSSKPYYIFLNFSYRYTDIRVSSFKLTCRYNDGSIVHKTINNRNRMHNLYLISISSINIRSCKMAAVASDGTIGQYSRYVKVK